MEIRYNRYGRYVAISDEDIERLGQEYVSMGGRATLGIPFFAFVAVEAHNFQVRADRANPIHAFTAEASALAGGDRRN